MGDPVSDRAPPELWTRLLRRVLPPDEAEALLPELAILFARRLERDGPTAARRWYRREALAVAAAWPAHVTRRALAGAGSPRRGREGLGRVLRAGRSLARSPGLSLSAVLTLGLGIGATTVVFSVVDHVALRPLPYPEPQRLVAIWPGEGLLRGEIDVMQRHANELEAVGGYLLTGGFNLELDDESLRIGAVMASPELLGTLGVVPASGRSIQESDAAPGAPPAAMLYHGFWRDRFGSDPQVVGRKVRLDGRDHEVVGVLPRGFSFPEPEPDVLVPLEMNPADAGVFWGYGGHRAVGRVRPGASPASAAAELQELSVLMRTANTLWTPEPDFRSQSRVVPLHAELVGDVQRTLWLLLASVLLVLMASAASVANLLMARGLSRSRDMALRRSLGAGRARLVIDQVLEGLVLAGAGCLFAIGIAWWGLPLLTSFLPPDLPRVQDIELDARIALAGAVLAVLAGVGASLLPALRGSGADPAAMLRSGARGGGRTAAARRLSQGTVVVQVALAIVLVVGAGLLLRSLSELSAVAPGFDPEGVLTTRITLAGERYDEPSARRTFFDDVLGRVSALPGVRSAALAATVPFDGRRPGMATFIDGVTDNPNALPVLTHAQVTPDYFRAMGIPILEGRALSEADDGSSPLVAVVDRTAADRFWPGGSPIGARIRYPWAGAPWIEVIGVVGGTADRSLAEDLEPAFYVPAAQNVPGQVYLVARSEGVPGALLPAIRAAIDAADPTVPLSSTLTMSERLAESMARSRWTASLVALFAGIVLVLGSVGVHGVMAYSVRERTAEIGVRMALGADGGRVRRGILSEGVRLTLVGVGAGMAVAVPLTSLFGDLLYGVSALDPGVLVTAPAVLVLAGVFATYLPARWATRIAPVEALRASD